MPIEFDGPNSKVSANTIQAQSGSTITILSGHNLSGGGSGLTALNAANLTGTLAAISGANLTALNATQATSGTLPMARLSGTLPALNGSALTNLPAPSSLAATALTGAITATANGEVVMSSQPAFQVKLSGADQNNIAVGSLVTILFDTEIFDQNADFNTGTYTFTAPVTGRYQLNVNLQLENVDSGNTEYIDVQIITSNRTYRNLFDPQKQLNADSYYFNLNFSALADMDANDTAYVVCKQHNGTAQTDVDANWTMYSGYLAC